MNELTNGAGAPAGLSMPISQDLAAGLFLALIGLFFLWQSSDLPMGTLRAVGPGMLPRAVALMLVAGGLGLAVIGLFDRNGIRMPIITFRGPFFIIAGILIFAVLIRSAGLAAAGPAAMIVASYASKETRPLETTVFAIVMTAVCIFIFKYLLNLPIPVIANYW